MKTKPVWFVSALLSMVALTLVGCGSGNHDDNNNAATTDAFIAEVMRIVASSPDDTEPVAIDAFAATTPDNNEPTSVI